MNIPKKKQTHWYRGQASSYQWGDRKRAGEDRDMGLRGTEYYAENE